MTSLQLEASWHFQEGVCHFLPQGAWLWQSAKEFCIARILVFGGWRWESVVFILGLQLISFEKSSMFLWPCEVGIMMAQCAIWESVSNLNVITRFSLFPQMTLEQVLLFLVFFLWRAAEWNWAFWAAWASLMPSVSLPTASGWYYKYKVCSCTSFCGFKDKGIFFVLFLVVSCSRILGLQCSSWCGSTTVLTHCISPENNLNLQTKHFRGEKTFFS